MAETGQNREEAIENIATEMAALIIQSGEENISLEEAARKQNESISEILPEDLSETVEKPSLLATLTLFNTEPEEKTINKVIEKTGKSKEEVIAVLKQLKGPKGYDMSSAIIYLQLPPEKVMHIFDAAKTYDERKSLLKSLEQVRLGRKQEPAPALAPVPEPEDNGDGLDPENIKFVMQQTGYDRRNAIAAIRRNNDDPVLAVMDLTNQFMIKYQFE
jgi:NACalpha-BTF3-like transcription factor